MKKRYADRSRQNKDEQVNFFRIHPEIQPRLCRKSMPHNDRDPSTGTLEGGRQGIVKTDEFMIQASFDRLES